MKQLEVLKSIMGEELYESLNKALVKLNTKSVVDLAELHSAIKSVPKSIIAFLLRELKDMNNDETREIKMPWAENSQMTITKLDNDVYKGVIIRDSKIVHDFNLTAIPQLAAHIMSCFEIYDEAGGEEEAKEKSPLESDGVKEQLKMLDDKINALMMIVASKSIQKSEDKWTKDIHKIAKNNYDAMIKPNLKKKFIDSVKQYSLKKTGLAPKMPSPPQPGTKVGGNQGITQAGIRSDKTPHSDFQTKPTKMQNPYMKSPKAADGAAKPAEQAKTTKLTQSEKTLTFKKSELDSKCTDCGQKSDHCACFRALSKPEIKKSEGQNVTLKFKSDWDSEAIEALYKSIKKMRT